MNRRDFLKLGGIAGLAALTPLELFHKFNLGEWWEAPADAAIFPVNKKTIWNARLNTGMPDLYSLYGMVPVPQLLRNTVAGWTDPLAEPDATWHQSFAANIVARNLPVKTIHFDHEDWPVSTQGERVATATKFANFARTFKTNLPGYKIGFYAYPLVTYTAPTALPGSANYTTMQTKNEDFAETYSVVDILCPTVYFYYTRFTAPLYKNDFILPYFFIINILEQRRLAKKYGLNQPIYPYVWEREATTFTPLDLDTYELMCRLSYQYADGMTIWGGFFDLSGTQAQQTWAQDTGTGIQGAWWNNLLFPMISAGRFWNQAVAG